MTSWQYNPQSRKAGIDPNGIIPRVRLEEAADLLNAAGIRNRRLIVDVLAALSGLSKGEVRFNVELALQQVREISCAELPD